jgi:phosphatidylinositol alpha-1,6-mannosyltransferase
MDGLEMHMLGRIPEGHRIRAMAQELGLENRIAFHGFVPSPIVFDYLNSADLVLIPSLSEGFSVTAIEAMALGKPIVGTNVGGIPTAVKDGRNATLVGPEPGELAAAIRQLLREPGRMRAMSEVNWNDAAMYDWGLIGQMYIDYFDGIISRCQAPIPRPGGL